MGGEPLGAAPTDEPIGNPRGTLRGNIEGNGTKGPLRLLPGAGMLGPAEVPVVGEGAGAGAGGGGGGSSDAVVSGWPPISGGGFSTSFATVFRVTIGITGADASLAPEPTEMTMPDPAVEPADPPGPRLGKPVMLPGIELEMPPPPMMKNGRLYGVPLTPEAAPGPGPLPSPEGVLMAPGKGVNST